MTMLDRFHRWWAARRAERAQRSLTARYDREHRGRVRQWEATRHRCVMAGQPEHFASPRPQRGPVIVAKEPVQ